MNEIDPRSRLALELARSDAEPSVADKLRVLEALQARLGPTPVIPATAGERGASQTPATPVAAPGVASSSAVGKVIAVGAIAALLGLGAGLSLRSAPPVASTAVAAAPARVEPATSSKANDEPVVSAPIATVAAQPEPTPDVATTAPSKRAAPRARATRSASEPELYQALELLRRAQRALRKQEAALSLALLDEIDQRFAASVLAEERQATRVLALCLRGDEAAAQQIARALLAQNPATIYAARVRESCAGSERQSPAASPNAGK
jgi:hypothetical protein